MGAISSKLRNAEGGGLTFWCPGCARAHTVRVGDGPGPRWNWNGSADRPTFQPSVLVTWSEPSDDPALAGDPAHDVSRVCHSFVTDGQIQFLGDCTHALAGQTVPLPDKW